MYIYDSSLKKEIEFKPIKDKEVRIYVCGPTVYDDAHLGHARSSIVFDILRRYLMELGFKVTFMKNFTDIDDKIIKKVKETGKTLYATLKLMGIKNIYTNLPKEVKYPSENPFV